MAWIIAASVHELLHIVALNVCGYSIKEVAIGCAGAQIKTDAYAGKRMIICALAGPLSGFVLFALLKYFPRIAICGLVQSLGNLIPLYPLDGGRVLRNVLNMLFSNQVAFVIFKIVEVIVILALLIISIVCTFRLNLGIMPVLMMCVFLIKKKYLAIKGGSEYNIGNRN
jgi:stage IV sporulation protein FB